MGCDHHNTCIDCIPWLFPTNGARNILDNDGASRSALAAFQYYQKGFVDVKAAMILAAFFFIGSYFGAKFALVIPQDILKKTFAVMIVGIAINMWFQK